MNHYTCRGLVQDALIEPRQIIAVIGRRNVIMHDIRDVADYARQHFPESVDRVEMASGRERVQFANGSQILAVTASARAIEGLRLNVALLQGDSFRRMSSHEYGTVMDALRRCSNKVPSPTRIYDY